MLEFLPQLIANGLIAGGIYALVALGYTLVYGILKFLNFAHGDVVMIAAYFAFVLNSTLGLNVWISLAISVVFAAVLGMTIEKIAYKPLRNSHVLTLLVTTIGVSLLLQSIALLAFGPEIKSYKTPESGDPFNIAGAYVTQNQAIILVTSIVLLVLLLAFYHKTKWGKATRATAEDRSVAQTLGIDSDKIISLTFAIGSGVGAVAGVLVGLEQSLTPQMGILLGVKAFTAAVVGGIGSIQGAMVGGYVVGIAENLGAWFLPSGYKDAIAFVILILFLLFKPTGLFGATKEEEVKS